VTLPPPTSREIATPSGPARVHVHDRDDARAALAMGHGAGGGVGARDVVAVAQAAGAAGLTVVLVEQPYRVAGRKAPPRAPVLDAAWTAVLEDLRAGELGDGRLIAGGRSSGARVACRTAAATGAAAVLCLAFPLRPPRRARGPEPPSRLPELEAVEVPVLVIQGDRDPFGLPPPGDRRELVRVPGTHGVSRDLPAVAAAARAWLERIA